MILSSHGVIASQLSGFDADAQAFITAAGITDATQKNAINTLVLNLKGYSIWSKMKAIYPFVGGTATTHKYNLKDPRDLDAAFRLVFSGGWTHSSTGATPNGTNGYADTILNPNSELSINSSHMSSYVNTTPNDGMLLGNGALSCFHQYAVNILYGGLANTSFIQTASTNQASFTMVNRPSSSTINLYKNNSKLFENTSNNGSSYTNPNITIAKYGSSFFQDARYAFASIGDGLTHTEALNFYTSVQAFQTTLNRQV
jgi:hypothetical protein